MSKQWSNNEKFAYIAGILTVLIVAQYIGNKTDSVRPSLILNAVANVVGAMWEKVGTFFAGVSMFVLNIRDMILGFAETVLTNPRLVLLSDKIFTVYMAAYNTFIASGEWLANRVIEFLDMERQYVIACVKFINGYVDGNSIMQAIYEVMAPMCYVFLSWISAFTKFGKLAEIQSIESGNKSDYKLIMFGGFISLVMLWAIVTYIKYSLWVRKIYNATGSYEDTEYVRYNSWGGYRQWKEAIYNKTGSYNGSSYRQFISKYANFRGTHHDWQRAFDWYHRKKN